MEKKAGKVSKAVTVLRQILILLLILLFFSLTWCADNFGNIGLNEIIFTLNMPLKGAADNYFIQYFIYAVVPTVIVFTVLTILCVFPKKKSYSLAFLIKNRTAKITVLPLKLNALVWALICVMLTVELLHLADNNFQLFDYMKSQIQASEFIENEYVDAKNVKITFPEEKRNLICIYLESAETSFQDKANGGMLEYNVIPELTEIAKNNISFSHSELLEGAAVAPACGWTMAGLVAQTAGLPLKLYKYDDNGDTGSAQIDNSMIKYAAFMPGATTLGEILEKEGYRNYFMAGSDFTFGGRRDYYTQHGNYTIYDLETAREDGIVPQDYKNGWGFEDVKLYAYAKEKLSEIAAKGQPFHFSLLTVDTHMGATPCPVCPKIYEGVYANAWVCASRQLDDFLDWIQQQDFYENTTICITGDHASMQKGFIENHEYDRYTGENDRKVYNAFVNAVAKPVRMKNRQFNTMDLFPTVLASIGAKIEGERLGLGTNLFSGADTLTEQYGFEVLREELNKKSRFYDNEILYPSE